VIARGLSNSLDDLARLRYVPGISGAIIGRALFSGDVHLRAALDLVEAPMEPVAEFI
jgi:phosphoribosylformimino-5-aminoimidazole carboxamide ribotide isomerase